jgi:hypothetical protein
MRHVSKALIITMGLIAVSLLSSGVRADDLTIGTFKLPHPTSWKGMMLPAGDYTFKLANSQSDVRVLTVQGEKSKKTLNMLVFAQAACQNCRKSELTLAVNGDNRAVSSLELPGYHVDFRNSWSSAEREQMARKTRMTPEQVAVQSNSSN